VLGDLFQQYAAKYIGISRGIPLSNTNQLWGLAWGVLVFGELANMTVGAQALVVAGSLIMIAGATAISLAEAPQPAARVARGMERECMRYGLDRERVAAALTASDPFYQRSRFLAMVGDAHRWCRCCGIHLVGNVRGEASHRCRCSWLLTLAAASVALLLGGGSSSGNALDSADVCK